MSNVMLQEINTYFNKVVPDQNFQRMGMTFETENKKYFYDTGTGKVLECSDGEYAILDLLIHNSDLLQDMDKECLEVAFFNIKEAIKSENILQTPYYDQFEEMGKDELEGMLSNGVSQIILEVTEGCNLRCKYCVFNEYNPSYRNFEKKSMTWETAKKALDFLAIHGDQEVTVAFYGGEPLINFELIKRCIDYSKKHLEKKKRVNYSFTTNLTLMDKMRAEYFAALGNCSITGSIDGPELIHDTYRITVNDNGTFQMAMKGLNYLLDAYGERAREQIIINAVVCPPYSPAKFEMLNDFFGEISEKGVEVKYSYVEKGSLREEDILSNPSGETVYENRNFLPIDAWAMGRAMNNEKTQYEEMLLRDDLVRVHNRFLITQPRREIRRNGCCMPGKQRLYIKVDGTFAVCEKIGLAPSIGNVEMGFDFDAIMKHYIEDFDHAAIKQCSSCWAANHCGSCYASWYGENGIDMEAREQVCQTQRFLTKSDLISYYQLLESRPDIIERISQIQMF